MNLRKSRGGAVLSAWLVSLLLTACGEKPEAMLVSAKAYLAKNDNKAAVIQIKNALQVDPNRAEARFLLGTALLDSGDAVGAETELRKALDLKYPQDLVMVPLANALLAQGHAKKLTDEFSKTELSQAPAKAGLQMALAAAYAVQGKTELAQAALAAALRADPTYAPALLAQARQKAAQQDLEGAQALVDEVIAKSPQNLEAWKLKGDILLYAKNQPLEALAAYRKAVESKPDFLPGQAAITTLLLQEGKLGEAATQIESIKKFAAQHPQTKFLEAQLAFQKKDIKTARDLLQQVLKANPGNVQALQLAGAVEVQLGAWLPAQANLSRALQLAPELTVARRLLVVSYLRSGQPAKALEALLPGLSREPIDPGLLAVAGEVYLQNGDVKQAQAYFAKASQQNPKDSRNRTSLALTHLMDGQVDSAFGELNEIAVSDAGTTADLALISLHLKRAEFDQALKAIDGLEKKQPDKPLAAQLRARTLLAKRDLGGARKSLERALAIDPSYFPAIAGLAGIDMLEKKPEQAKQRFEAVLAKDPKSAPAWLALAEMASRSGAAKEEVAKLLGNAVAATPAEVAPRLLLIDFHLRNKDVKAASSAAQSAVATLPDSAELLDALGRTQQAAGDLNQAVISYNKLAGLQPLSPQPHLRLAGVHITEKKMDEAGSSLRKALELKPDLLDAQRALIAVDLEGKKLQEALAIAHTVQKQRPKEAVGYALEGDIHVAQKNWVAAATAYRAGLKQARSTELVMKLHSVLLADAQGTEADKLAASWQKDNPKDAGFLLYQGNNALGRKDFGAAEKHYEAVVKLQPDNAIAYNNLAWVSVKLKKGGALAYAEKANALVPNQPAFMDTLAMVLSEKGDYAQALALQNKALALQPQNNLFKLNLAKIHIQGGKKELAKKELDELSKLGGAFAAQSEVDGLMQVLYAPSGTN